MLQWSPDSRQVLPGAPEGVTDETVRIPRNLDLLLCLSFRCLESLQSCWLEDLSKISSTNTESIAKKERIPEKFQWLQIFHFEHISNIAGSFNIMLQGFVL